MPARAPSLIGVLLAQPSAGAVGDLDPAAPLDQSCILNLESGEYRCFDSVEDAVVDFTNGKVTNVTTSAHLADPEMVQAVDAEATSSVILAIFWDGSNYSGASLLMEASSGCDDNLDVDWSWLYLRSDWDDRFNSGKGYSRCQIKIWEQESYSGASLGYFQQDNDFGVLNNQTESVRMR